MQHLLFVRHSQIPAGHFPQSGFISNQTFSRIFLPGTFSTIPVLHRTKHSKHCGHFASNNSFYKHNRTYPKIKYMFRWTIQIRDILSYYNRHMWAYHVSHKHTPYTMTCLRTRTHTFKVSPFLHFFIFSCFRLQGVTFITKSTHAALCRQEGMTFITNPHVCWAIFLCRCPQFGENFSTAIIGFAVDRRRTLLHLSFVHCIYNSHLSNPLQAYPWIRNRENLEYLAILKHI